MKWTEWVKLKVKGVDARNYGIGMGVHLADEGWRVVKLERVRSSGIRTRRRMWVVTDELENDMAGLA